MRIGPLQRQRQPVEQQRPVRDARERVVQRLVVDRLLRLRALDRAADHLRHRLQERQLVRREGRAAARLSKANTTPQARSAQPDHEAGAAVHARRRAAGAVGEPRVGREVRRPRSTRRRPATAPVSVSGDAANRMPTCVEAMSPPTARTTASPSARTSTIDAVGTPRISATLSIAASEQVVHAAAAERERAQLVDGRPAARRAAAARRGPRVSEMRERDQLGELRQPRRRRPRDHIGLTAAIDQRAPDAVADADRDRDALGQRRQQHARALAADGVARRRRCGTRSTTACGPARSILVPTSSAGSATSDASRPPRRSRRRRTGRCRRCRRRTGAPPRARRTPPPRPRRCAPRRTRPRAAARRRSRPAGAPRSRLRRAP